MKVLHFYKSALPDSMGGIEQVIDQLCRVSLRYGIESEVLSLTPFQAPRTVEINGYKIHRAKKNLQIASTGMSLSAVLRFSELAKKADIIHYHFPWPFMDLVHFVARINKPTVVTYHSDIVRQKVLLRFYKPLMHLFLNDVDRIVATSPNYLMTSKVLHLYKEKVSVIPIGLDRSILAVPTEDIIDNWRQRFGTKFFLFVGVLRYYKGLHILIEAAKGCDFPIVIVGSGPVERELKAEVQEMGISNVHFLGTLPDVDKVALIKLCFAVIFPSHLRSEAFGISLLEGAMFGKPMISSEIGTGTTYINLADETGLVVPAGDPVALRQAMYELWANPDKAAEMGRRAEQRYFSLFTADKMSQSYANLYSELIGH